MNEKLIEMIKRHEGLRLFPYKCSAGKITIGYGRNLDDKGITKREAEELLWSDIQEAAQNTMSIFPQFYTYTIARQNALIDLMFNLGKTRFLKFKKMIAAVKEEDWTEAAKQAKDSQWHNQVGGRALDIEDMLERGI